MITSRDTLVSTKVYSHGPSESSFILPFKNGWNALLWRCSHTTLKYVININGAADQNGNFNGTCEYTLSLTVVARDEVFVGWWRPHTFDKFSLSVGHKGALQM